MAESALQPGMVLNNRYRLSEHLGNGGMAEVWLANDETLGRQVAVKVLLDDLAVDPSFRQRFKREAAAMAAADNRFLVSIYDYGYESTNGLCYIVMEFVPGFDLKTMIEDNGPVPQKMAAKIGAQVCSALSSIHAAGITHNDIKPANVMIKPNGDACVMDLGIFKPQNAIDENTGNMVLGTVAYCSPEQCRGEQLTPCSDIYSLGIMLYEIVSGQVPFTGNDPIEVATKQCEELPAPLSTVVPGIDPNFESIVMRALEKDPRARFMSAAEMGRALEAYASGRQAFENAPTQLMGAQPGAVGQTHVMPGVDGENKKYVNGEEQDDTDGKKPKMDPKKKKIIIGSSIAGAVALIAIIVAIVMALSGGNVQVPNVSGKSVDEATTIIEQQGLTVSSKENVPSKDVEQGKVVGTDPDAGKEVAKGSGVKLEVSSGPAQVEIPDVTGMTEAQAVSALKSAGLTPKAGTSVSSDSVREGSVVSTSPSHGTPVDAGTTVEYSLSSGKSTVQVPDVSGMSESEALNALKSAGLTGKIGSQKESDSVESGCVIAQNPSSGVKVAAGETVTLTISSGSSSVTVPSVTGLTQSAARSTLINAGLTLGSVSEEYSSEPSGTVISQSIADGSSAKKGQVVDIVVSKGQQPSQQQPSSTNNSSTNSGNGSNPSNNNNGSSSSSSSSNNSSNNQ